MGAAYYGGQGHVALGDQQQIHMPMRFIQMWFIPSERDLAPSVEQKSVAKEDRTNMLLPLVSNEHEGALPIHSDARVYSCFLQGGHSVEYS
jgi:redox-sensitive bicupin YhaK (pirin superfamily)